MAETLSKFSQDGTDAEWQGKDGSPAISDSRTVVLAPRGSALSAGATACSLFQL